MPGTRCLGLDAWDSMPGTRTGMEDLNTAAWGPPGDTAWGRLGGLGLDAWDWMAGCRGLGLDAWDSVPGRRTGMDGLETAAWGAPGGTGWGGVGGLGLAGGGGRRGA